MSKKQIFEIPESPESVVFYAGREISIDGKTIVEVDRASACSGHLLTETARAYCVKHWFNPVFVYSEGNLPMLIGFVFDEESFNSFSCVPHGSIVIRATLRKRLHAEPSGLCGGNLPGDRQIRAGVRWIRGMIPSCPSF